MDILIVSQYFWPENFRINDLALALDEAGHKITILTGLPNYPEGEIMQSAKQKHEQTDLTCGDICGPVRLLTRKQLTAQDQQVPGWPLLRGGAAILFDAHVDLVVAWCLGARSAFFLVDCAL